MSPPDLPRLAGVGVLALLAGCTVGPNWTTPAIRSPAAWHGADAKPAAPAPSVAVTAPLDPSWWTLFHDAELTTLQGRLAADNLDVQLATVRLIESRGERRVVGADQFPSVNSNASYTREKVSPKGVLSLFGGSGSTASSANGLGGRQGGIPTGLAGASAGPPPPFNLFQYGFDASWELDLWGRVRREVEAADASVEQSADARRGALLSAQAELARDYVQLRGEQTELAIAEQNIGSEQQSLQLTQARARGGLTTQLDVSNATAVVANAQAQIPSLQAQQADTTNAIALLLGEAPGALTAELQTASPVPPVPPQVPVGVPSELARRRPDIRQAEAALHQATADIGVAVADFYPKITLDGSIGIQALKAKDLGNWDARQYSGGPSISLPIFEGGRLRATLELRRAQQQEAALQYQRTVLNAWHEVDDALTAYRLEQDHRDALARVVAANQDALDLARLRYRAGLDVFLNVLDAERSLLSAQLAEAQSTTAIAGNMVQLYKALGGGWETDFPVVASR